ncbi:MAG TPA: hypothetical protein VLN57_21375 [Xanthobacteraceae bacterium]|nr:hypothetical protein [Xanthobacteraceae bacterium]
MWHASIALRGHGGMLSPFLHPFERWRFKEREILKREVIALLSGVGVGVIRRDRGEDVLHARRRLSAAELAMLDPAWCALPAVDIAGGDLPW